MEIARVLVGIIFRPVREGVLAYRGQVHSFPLPCRSIRLAEFEGHVAYLTLGNPRPESWLVGQAERYSWSYVEQLGAAHIMVGGGYRLTFVMRQCTRYLTLLEFIVTDQASPP